jgi:hypothetical protein
METINWENNITVLYVEATSFPEGIAEAHQKLQTMVPLSEDRKYFGISRPEDGVIGYKAAAEQLDPKEPGMLNCKTLVLKKGNYISLDTADYMKDIQSITRAFEILLEHPGLDPQGYCVEWYVNNKDVKCMIRLAEF